MLGNPIILSGFIRRRIGYSSSRRKNSSPIPNGVNSESNGKNQKRGLNFRRPESPLPSSPQPYPLSHRDCVVIIKTGPELVGRDGRVKKSKTCLREAASAKAGRKPFIYEFQTFHILEMTPLSASINHSFLKDRILRLWNPSVSSTRAPITAQSPKRERVSLPTVFPLRS
jgi:hypothetical protein